MIQQLEKHFIKVKKYNYNRQYTFEEKKKLRPASYKMCGPLLTTYILGVNWVEEEEKKQA